MMMTRIHSTGRALRGVALAGAAMMAGLGTVSAAQLATIDNPALSERIEFSQTGQPVSGSLAVPAGQSQVLEFSSDIAHSLIADPEVADIIPMTDRSLYVLGKARGITTLTLMDGAKRLKGVFKINVTHDLGALKQSLYEMAPGEGIEVRESGDSVVLSGRASSPAAAAMAARIAQQHGVTDIINAVDTGQSQQVMLKVRIAEVDRTVSKRMNLSTNAFYDQKDTLRLFSGLLDAESFVSGIANIRMGEFDVGFVLDALEQQGLITTLAEPSLVAMNGQTAYFLAGGEFPIPVGSQAADDGSLQIRIEFKEFGVRLAYTPTIIGENINLVIEPEVSALDPQNGIVLNSVEIPALTTRRASTTVEMKNGQSFAIAGLLQEQFESEIRGIPGISSIPILGALARSPQYARRETELLIIVTPYFVEPYEGSDYVLPTDLVDHPSDSDLFIGGRVENGRAQ